MTLRIVIHNVGHGQAIHAFTPAGETIVIDLGCSSNFSPLEWLSQSTKTIDKLIISHPPSPW
jgi:beta-lactamase superfamily II metal-dependent hydrolase